MGQPEKRVIFKIIKLKTGEKNLFAVLDVKKKKRTVCKATLHY